MPNEVTAQGGRGANLLRGVLIGVAGHVVLAVWILLAFASADNAEERGTSVMPALVELFVVPGVLVLALVRSFDRSARARAGGLVIGTILGLTLVAGVTLAIEVRHMR
jgi:hypothetical protein